jgi:hypothetical protein
MSGYLRQRIDLDRQRLQTDIENLPNLAPVIDEWSPLVETHANLQVLLVSQKGYRDRIQDVVSLLQRYNEKWQAITSDLEEENRVAEQELYNNMLATHGNFVTTMEDGRGVLETLQRHIEVLMSELEALIDSREQVEGIAAPQVHPQQSDDQQTHETAQSGGQQNEGQRLRENSTADASAAAESEAQPVPIKQPQQASREEKGGRGRPAQAMNARAKWKSPCAFCNGSHFHDECPVVITINDHRQRMREQRVCFKCLLSSDHMAQHCTVNKVCFHCKGSHHSAFCDRRPEQRPAQQGPGGGYVGPLHQPHDSAHQVNYQPVQQVRYGSAFQPAQQVAPGTSTHSTWSSDALWSSSEEQSGLSGAHLGTDDDM